MDVLGHLYMRALVSSCVCPGWGPTCNLGLLELYPGVEMKTFETNSVLSPLPTERLNLTYMFKFLSTVPRSAP